ncbi:neutral/alkaline non-lysosomal ceramidase N-terminal domain-containing protein [Candidatus Sumerlaeota bacterium]|nr:neutral/alkaline non-lysosomal ceramidase N-terminal domain-containing protein [Candidatus Sumerlaeota bacterium]
MRVGAGKIFKFALFLFCAGCATAPAPRGSYKAGVGRAVITPKQDMWLGGYAARKEPSNGKLHDLFAKALVIQDENGAKTAIVTTDLLGIPREIGQKIAAGAAERFGLPRERLLINCSHTHSGPAIRGNLDMYPLDEAQTRLVNGYTDALPGMILDAIADAMKRIEPCRIYYGIGRADFAANRRRYTPDGIAGGVNPIGAGDHDVPVVKVVDQFGGVKAVLAGYACHNTTLDIQQFNGDYAGFAQIYLEKRLPGAAAMFVQGCGGDQNPEPRRKIELAEKYGEELGRAAMRVMAGKMREIRGPIRAAYKEIALPLSAPPPREEIEKDLKGDMYHSRRAKALLKTLDENGKLETAYPYPIQILEFGDAKIGAGLIVVALGGEVVVDYSLRLKHELGRERTWVAGYSNDVMAYIPSWRILKEGGYEGGDAMVYYGLYGPWDKTVEEEIIKGVHELLGR